MNKVVKTMLITIGINLLAGLLICLPAIRSNGNDGDIIGASLIITAGLLIQLVMGLVIAASQKQRKTGQGMLLAVGILFVIGFAVCSNINVRL
jgi:hypothetical protein